MEKTPVNSMDTLKNQEIDNKSGKERMTICA